MATTIDQDLAANSFRLPLSKAVAIVLTILNANMSARGQEPGYFSGHNGAVMMAAFAEDNDRVVTASSDLTAKLWDVKTGQSLQSWGQHTGPL